MLPLLKNKQSKYNQNPLIKIREPKVINLNNKTVPIHVDHKDKSMNDLKLNSYDRTKISSDKQNVNQFAKQLSMRTRNHCDISDSCRKDQILCRQKKSPKKPYFKYKQKEGKVFNHIQQLQKKCKKIIREKNIFSLGNFTSMIQSGSQMPNIDHQNINNGSNVLQEQNIKNCSISSKRSTLNLNFDSFEANNKLFNISQNFLPINQNSLTIRRITTQIKPPHRYKTTMAISQNSLILYGGLGCEKDITWAKLNYEAMNWEKPNEKVKEQRNDNQFHISLQSIRTRQSKKQQYQPQTPIYGHTMVRYRDKAIVFGGNCTTEINETTIICMNNMAIKQGERCPCRRRDHAAVICGEYMIVHGGIHTRETMADFLAYNVPQNKWSLVPCLNSPALSCHGFASTDASQPSFKGKKVKSYYIFGGKNQYGKAKNTLYRIWMVSQKQIKCQKVQTINAPSPRFSFCFQGVSANNILLYGGKQNEQATNLSKNLRNGVFNDLYLYNTQTRYWTSIQQEQGQENIRMQYCFGMASTSISGRVFIFGGSTPDKYCDASLYTICFSSSEAQALSNKNIYYGNNKSVQQQKNRMSYKLLI